MENRAAVTRDRAADNILKKFFRWFVDWAVVTDMPVEVFTQKLADNRIVGSAGALTDEMIKDIAQKYEAFGAEVGAYFESRARLLSVLIAFAVAWFFYVHPYDLAVAYTKNPEVAQDVANLSAKMLADYEALTKASENKSEPGDSSPEDTKELTEAVNDLKAKLLEAQKQTEQLANIGAPVGWPQEFGKLSGCFESRNEAPASAPPASDDDKNLTSFCRLDVNLYLIRFDVPVPSIVNAFWLLVGGLLVGLGAPFWAQAVSSLTASRDVTRKIAAIVTPERPADQAAVAPAGAGRTTPSTAVATFKVANEAGRNT